MLQKMIFEAGDPPPFNDLKALPDDTPMNPIQRAKELESRHRKTRTVPRTNEDVDGMNEDPNAPFVVSGYVGRNKGIFQVTNFPL